MGVAAMLVVDMHVFLAVIMLVVSMIVVVMAVIVAVMIMRMVAVMDVVMSCMIMVVDVTMGDRGHRQRRLRRVSLQRANEARALGPDQPRAECGDQAVACDRD